MPILRTRKWVEGQTIKFTLYTGKILTEATALRLYYKIPGSEGFWTSPDVIIFDTYFVQYIHRAAIKGFYSVFPHVEFADGNFISRSADPLQFYVKGIHEI